jgi:hypothetical protein
LLLHWFSFVVLFLRFILTHIKIFEQNGKEQVQEDHHADNYQAEKIDDGYEAILSCEFDHGLVPVFTSEDRENDDETIKEGIKRVSA